MEKYCVLTDSSCDIDDLTAARLGIYVLRMPIVIEGHEFMDGRDITVDDIKKYLKNGIPAKTSQATLGDLEAMYEKLLKNYEQIVFIPLSSGLSGMYETALAQAQKYEGRITVIDAKCACYPVTRLCLDVLELLKRGESPEMIKERIESEESIMEAVIIPDDLQYLKMGGRITPAAAALANLLRITPVLYLKGGVIDVLDKVHTLKKAISKGLEPILQVDDYQAYYWMVIADEKPLEADHLQKQMAEITGQTVEMHEFGPVILSHTGPGTLAFGRLKKLI